MSKYFLILFVATSLPYLDSNANNKQPPSDVREYSQSFLSCLERSEEACLLGLLPEKMYFPEWRDFGCEIADKKGEDITEKELAKCVRESEAISTCGNGKRTLKEVLRHCFGAGNWHDQGGFFEPVMGEMCHITKEGGKWVLNSVTCGC
ncbi:hypothetical protein ACLVWU_13985 [Bdellovibrio sp. HCB290]|uniref:hypothetical protein n=1 Tax=Bdellovibrio sp. HCB290 TaxID=3394356 RepID=UPI0039B423B6